MSYDTLRTGFRIGKRQYFVSTGRQDFGNLGNGQFTGTQTGFAPILSAEPNWKTFTSGDSSVGAITQNGELWTWGRNQRGELGLGDQVYRSSPVQVGSLTDWAEISVLKIGPQQAMAAIKIDGTLWTWGHGTVGALGNNTVRSYSSPIQIGSLTDWKKISGNYYGFHAIKSNGTLWAWGYNAFGQLGDNSTIDQSSPIQIGSSNDWYEVEGGGQHVLAIKTDGTLWAWGTNSSNYGQLGLNNQINYSSPVQVGTGTNWQEVTSYSSHVLAVKTDGTLWAWGDNTNGQLGFGPAGAYYSSPIQIGSLTDWKNVKAGYFFSLATKKDGSLWGWGNNPNAQIGINSGGVPYSSPIQVSSLNEWLVLGSSQYGSFALSRPGTDLGQQYTTREYMLDAYPNISSALGARTQPGLWVFGRNLSGELGTNSINRYSSPVQAGSLTDWKQISIGHSFSLGIRTANTLFATGVNNFGQLGDNTSTNQSSPVLLAGGSVWKQVAAGKGQSGAVRTDGTLWMWGLNDWGQLGVGTGGLARSTAIQVGTLTNWATIACGYKNTASIKRDGTLWTWGLSTNGTLGLNSSSSFSSPVQVGTNTNWKQVSIGLNFMLAVTTTGTLYAWGTNSMGQLGISNTVNYSSPVQVGTSSDWMQVAAGQYHSMAVKTNNTLWVWGDNTYGQVGNNSSIQYFSSPIQIGSLSNWKKISGGLGHSAAVTSDGKMYAWGNNDSGQLGLNSIVNSSSPTQVGTLTTWRQVSCGYNSTIAIQDSYWPQ